ncbi:sister chromatid cohesion protein PDS5 [Thermococcus sp. AM4]|uniref:sister chromatid cohesion protein PDS5 n=1 Tax=Thermococcus sp. (strain AM4) TaxID=246969 RepID=UPI000187132D|nr:sister chromatid cohesion protein PDS5 [Thermococcus sp. AM4]EEB74312.1 HEAT repeat domain protein [Thermococcus sp. AM4]
MEEELDVREALATGEKLDEVIVRASYDKDVLDQVIKYLDDDLWIVQKNALIVIMNVIEDHEELIDPLLRKLLVMIRKSEAIPLTLEIARAIGVLSRIKPELVRGAVPVILANYRIGDPKIRINMAYVLEEIMRNNPRLLGNIAREIASMLTSPDETDRLAALNFISALAENQTRYATPFLPRLLSLLYDRNEIVRISAVETLTELALKSPKFRKIIKVKFQELNDRSELVMEKVKEGLMRIALAESEEESG